MSCGNLLFVKMQNHKVRNIKQLKLNNKLVSPAFKEDKQLLK